jgi:hypothetical protein
MKKLIVSFVGGAVAFTVHAQVLFTYEFPGSDPGGDATVPVPEHLTLGAFARTQVNAASQSDAFSSSQWTQAAVPDPSEFVSFTFRPDIGYEVALTSLSWDTSRSSTGPQFGKVELFRNGLSLEGSEAFDVATTMGHREFDFTPTSGLASDSFEFRFYGWNASGTGNLRLDNVAVSGAITAVPEPSASGLVLATGLVGITWCRLRRARRCKALWTP